MQRKKQWHLTRHVQPRATGLAQTPRPKLQTAPGCHATPNTMEKCQCRPIQAPPPERRPIRAPATFVRPTVVSLREKAARNVRLGCGNRVALRVGSAQSLPRWRRELCREIYASRHPLCMCAARGRKTASSYDGEVFCKIDREVSK